MSIRTKKNMFTLLIFLTEVATSENYTFTYV